GDTQIDLSTLSNAVSAIARVSNKQPKAYSASDLRRTVETRLAQLGVTKDVRAQVLSHGRTSGVQEKHYDRHDYLPEKARALATWEAHLAEIERSASGAKVIKGRFGRAS
ncbi:MAG: integrase, partial [Burkholderiales bacterium]